MLGLFGCQESKDSNHTKLVKKKYTAKKKKRKKINLHSCKGGTDLSAHPPGTSLNMPSNFESILVSVFSKNHMALTAQMCLLFCESLDTDVTKPTKNPPQYLTVITNYTR